MRIISVAMLALLVGCSQSVQDYKAETPVLSLKDFFTGSGQSLWCAARLAWSADITVYGRFLW
ncbi:hypothetical protein [Alishewanella longhuensis]